MKWFLCFFCTANLIIKEELDKVSRIYFALWTLNSIFALRKNGYADSLCPFTRIYRL